MIDEAMTCEYTLMSLEFGVCKRLSSVLLGLLEEKMFGVRATAWQGLYPYVFD